jgi:hypothetical protein
LGAPQAQLERLLPLNATLPTMGSPAERFVRIAHVNSLHVSLIKIKCAGLGLFWSRDFFFIVITSTHIADFKVKIVDLHMDQATCTTTSGLSKPNS